MLATILQRTDGHSPHDLCVGLASATDLLALLRPPQQQERVVLGIRGHPRARRSQLSTSATQSKLLRSRVISVFNDTLAERLRRRPAKPMGSPRVGSNPTGVDVAGQWRARSVIACHQQSILEIHGSLPAGVRSCHALLPGPVPIPLGHAASLQTLCWGSTSLRSQACRSMRQDHSA